MNNNDFPINRDLISKLGGMSDDELRVIIKKIADAAGADSRKTERALANIRSLKKRAVRMSDEELKKIADSCDQEKVNAAINEIKKLNLN